MVSSVLSNFYVAAYGLINFSVFHASLTKSPGWRPTFKYYNRWLSLFGTLLCLGVMILMDYKTALATYICILLLYIIIKWVTHFLIRTPLRFFDFKYQNTNRSCNNDIIININTNKYWHNPWKFWTRISSILNYYFRKL